MKNLLLNLLIVIICSNGYSQDTAIAWQKSYGGSSYDIGMSIQQTTDGGYITAGYTFSDDGNISGNHGNEDVWIVKSNEVGTIQWQKCYGGTALDNAHNIQKTSDGGYIFAGLSYSNDGNVSGNHGDADFWIVKIDPLGEIQWQRCFGGTNMDVAKSIQQTSDGGYIVAGWSYSSDGDATSNLGEADFWIIKINSVGTLEWQKSYGGSGMDAANHVLLCSDGGYLISGSTYSDNGNVTINHGGCDFWVIKVNSAGIIQWQKSFGGSANDWANSAQETADGNFIIAGYSSSGDGDVTGNHGSEDAWIVQINSLGTLQWQKSYGGSASENAVSIQKTSDGGYIFTGWAYSTNGDLTSNYGESDCWIVKIDVSGAIQWQKNYGGSNAESGNCIQQTTDGNYIFVCWSHSNDGNVSGNHGGGDYWIVKLCAKSPLGISISDISYCASTTLEASDGFVSYLWNTGATTQMIEISNGGNYNVTATNSSGCPSESEILAPDPIPIFNEEQICLVTSDEITGKNLLVIDKTLNVGIDSILIYKMDSLTSQYEIIGSIAIKL